jgi:DNA-binding response OmpR family regulator
MSGEIILLIDDDATLRELLADQLRTAGYRTREAADGSIGLRLAAEAAPELIVLDVMMPGHERLGGVRTHPGEIACADYSADRQRRRVR